MIVIDHRFVVGVHPDIPFRTPGVTDGAPVAFVKMNDRTIRPPVAGFAQRHVAGGENYRDPPTQCLG